MWLKVAGEIGMLSAAFSYQLIPNKVVGSDTKMPFCMGMRFGYWSSQIFTVLLAGTNTKKQSDEQLYCPTKSAEEQVKPTAAAEGLVTVKFWKDKSPKMLLVTLCGDTIQLGQVGVAVRVQPPFDTSTVAVGSG